jgi:hypothetical protein
MTMSFRSLAASTRIAVLLVAAEAAAVIALGAAGAVRDRARLQIRNTNRILVRELRITDLALSSGTSYTRHPSQADLFAPHGEHPSAIEHFPAGSIVQPPAAPAPMPPDTPRGAAR